MSYVFPGSDVFPSSITLPDDSTVPNQANFAPGWEGNRNAAVYNRNHLAASVISNFQAGVAPPSSHNWHSFYWDRGILGPIDIYNRWRATATNAGAGLKWLMSLDGGRTWILCATTTSAVAPLEKCLVADPQDFVHFGASSVVYWGTTSVTAITSSGWNATQGVAWRNEGLNKEYFVGATQSGGSFTGAAASFSIVGPTATNKTSSLPSTWASGTNHVGEFFAATNPVNNHTFVAMGGVTPGSDTARILYAAFDVTAPSDVTPSLLTGKIISGFTYDAARRVFAMVTWDGTTSRCYTLDDPNGVGTWTLVSSIASVQFSGLYAVRGAWAFVYDSDALVSFGGSTTRTFLVSTDMGNTFAKTQMVWALGTSSTTAAGPDSILGANAGFAYPSWVVR